MDDQQDHRVDIAGFQQEPEEDQDQVENFIAAMTDALNEFAPIQVFRNILREAPVVSVWRWYDLTLLFLYDSRINVVRLLLEHEPEIARYRDRTGDHLLLHRAIMSPAVSVDMLKLVINAYPEAIREQTIHGKIPLHMTIDCNVSVECFLLILSRYPNASRVPAEKWDDDLPLHQCLRRVKPEIFVSSLLDVYPEAASVMTGRHETALVLACVGGFSLEIIHWLYLLYPEALTLKDYTNSRPLGNVCRTRNPSAEVVKFLLEKHPDASRVGDTMKQLPIHHAVKGASVDVIKMLIEAYPNSVHVTNRKQRLPLHNACGDGASLGVLQLLIDHYTGDERHHGGLSVVDIQGRLPIHQYVNSENARVETLRYLLELYPQCVHVANNHGKLPLHFACESNPPRLEIIRVLVEAAPCTVIQKQANGRTPIQSIRVGRRRERNIDIQTYLRKQQTEAVNAMKGAFTDVADTQLGLPDLVTAHVWSFAKPDLWEPEP